MDCATNSQFLKFSKGRQVESFEPHRPNLNAIELTIEAAEKLLQSIFSSHGIQEKSIKLQSNTRKELKQEMLKKNSKKIQKMLKEHFKISYISMIFGIKEKKIVTIQQHLKKNGRLVPLKRGKVTKISKDQIDILNDMFSNKSKGFGYLPAKLALDKWLKLCELPSGFIKLRYFRKLLHTKLGFSYKKNNYFKQQGNSIKNKDYRQKFVLWNIELIQMNKEFIFIDSKKGQPLAARQSLKSFNFTLIGAISINGII